MSTKKWVSDPAHSELQFKVKHMMVSNVTGSFQNFQAELIATREDLQDAEIRFSADVDSVFTGSKQRDEHLKSKDFFEADKYPKIHFVSTSFKKLDDEDYELTGDLTIRGVSRPLKLRVSYGGSAKDPWGNEKAGFSITGKINRKDWGLSYNVALETGGVVVSEEVRILGELQMAVATEEVKAEV